ncbi:MAG: hypothetical protein J0M22_08420 [Gammaproteobacteria bacterium]|nr:hypothetical protein [Gammaproteobacteria bacterium]
MKKMVFASLVLLSGCITMSGGPFVDVKSGLPYATLSGDEQSSDIKLWIGSVDGKFSRKSIFNEDMFAGDFIYLAPGEHVVDAYCNYLALNKYNRTNLKFTLVANEKYKISCSAGLGDDQAFYKITDSKNADVPFQVLPQ